MTSRATRLALITIAALSLASPVMAADQDRSATLLLKETAGLRRFGFPVHARLSHGMVGPKFRLERDGKPVPAQFRRVTIEGTEPYVSLDFNASIGPLETDAYRVLAGPDVPEGPEPNVGMNVERRDGAFQVSNGQVLGYVVPETLDGVFRSVKNVRLEFWRPEGRGLFLETKGGKRVRIGEGGQLTAKVTRSGPFVVALRFEEDTLIGEGRSVRSVVEMAFPNSKSWAEVRWGAQDDRGDVVGLVADLGLKVDLEPTIIDLGANNTVYGFLRGKERMTLESGPGTTDWLIRKGPPNQLTPFARSLPGAPNGPEGWAHVVDALRCTALAVDGFGETAHVQDSIEVDAAGELRVRRLARTGAPRTGFKSLNFWAHFVNNPPQIGAVTSPQAMQSPLVVEWPPESP